MASAAPINRVADQRVANMLEVHANLVGATSVELAFDERRATEALQHAERRARRFPPMAYCHARACADVPSQRRVNDAARRRVALDEREVDAPYRTLRELLGEIRLRRHRLRHDQ